LDGILGQVQPDRARADAVARSFLPDPSTVDDARIDRLSESIYEMGNQPGALTSLDPIIHQMATPAVRSRYLLQRRLPFIRSRTLVVWGEGDVMDPYPTWTREYARLEGAMDRSSKPWVVPGAEFRLLPTGHTPHWERPDLLVEVLLGFLTR
jgi:pimeloyl-ACP methyl ester carboxylesterase